MNPQSGGSLTRDLVSRRCEMLCQLCSKNVALVEASWEERKIHVCIPCALLLQSKSVRLEMKREVYLGEKKNKVERTNKSKPKL